MTKWYGSIVLSQKVYDVIKWFTLNWDKEIGAFGTGKLKNGSLYIEKLFFPQQKVTGASVNITPENWGPMLTEMTDDEIKNVCFYWHKHPNGTPGASHTDEEETYDAIMDTDEKKKFFGFAQSAKKGNDEIMWEARIEMRKPIFGTLDCTVTTEEDEKIEEECKKIIEEKIIKNSPTNKFYGRTNNFLNNINTQNQTTETHNNIVFKDGVGKNVLMNDREDLRNVDFAKIGVPKDLSFLSVQKSGAIQAFVGNKIEKIFLQGLDEKGTLNDFVKDYHSKETNDSDTDYKIYVINPKKKCLKKIQEGIVKFQKGYEKYIRKYLLKEIDDLVEKSIIDEADAELYCSAIESMDIEAFFDAEVNAHFITNKK